MQMNGLSFLSGNFIGEENQLLGEINSFLENVKFQNRSSQKFHLVHALIFPKSMSEEQIFELNNKIGAIYRQNGFDVLGGDTSSGQELNVFISTIVE